MAPFTRIVSAAGGFIRFAVLVVFHFIVVVVGGHEEEGLGRREDVLKLEDLFGGFLDVHEEAVEELRSVLLDILLEHRIDISNRVQKILRARNRKEY